MVVLTIEEFDTYDDVEDEEHEDDDDCTDDDRPKFGLAIGSSNFGEPGGEGLTKTTSKLSFKMSEPTSSRLSLMCHNHL